MDQITKSRAIELVQFLIEDLEMLQNGDWVPDDDSCEASISNAEAIKKFLEDLR